MVGPGIVPPASRGFTLIELLIVIAIIGILAAIAIPQYQRYQVRTQAHAALAEATAQRTPVEAELLQVGATVVVPPGNVTVSVSDDGRSAVITAQRPLGVVTLTRAAGAGWTCTHTFEIELPGCSADAGAPGGGNDGNDGSTGNDGDTGNDGNNDSSDEESTDNGNGGNPSVRGCRNTGSASLRETCLTLYPNEDFDWNSPGQGNAGQGPGGG